MKERPNRVKDLTGVKFGRLTVISLAPRPWKADSEWNCKCECGNSVRVRGGNLKNGHTTSCGHCLTIEQYDTYYSAIVKNGQSFLFDKEDLPLILSYSWSMDKFGYVHGCEGKTRFKLHRLLMGNPKEVVDHINGNPSDCRKSNLRITSQHRNTFNSALPKNSTTGFKGVCWDKKEKKYMAHIHPNGKMKFLGYYNSPIDAALAYDKAAFLYFGEYARPNFMKGEIPNEQQKEVLELERAG